MKVYMRKKSPQSNDINAGELGRYLARLASLTGDAKTGNRALSASLRELADFLITSKANSVSDALSIIRNSVTAEPEIPSDEATLWTRKETAKSLSQALPNISSSAATEPELSSDEAALLTKEEILNRIGSEITSRKQLALIGSVRFGIHDSRLQKLNREDLIRALLSAIEHERSIEILSDQARIGGERRKS